jgi:ubiquinone biosynthesis protein Coq4
MKKIKQLRSALLEFLTHKLALPLITRFRNNAPFRYSIEELLSFPEGTLGKDLALYLRQKNFSLLRNYERHDCKHLILGYEMDECGEARMQFYFLGNRHYSLPVLSTVLITFFLMPEHWSQFRKDFHLGRKGRPFRDEDYNQLVHLQTKELHKKYFPVYENI